MRIFSHQPVFQAQKEKEEKLQKEVHIDALTGAYNRKGIITHIEELLRQNPEAISTCVSLDIDNFKEVNDTFGHLYGDAVLSETAKKIQKLCRSDTLIGRLGGDEFVAFFPRLQSEEVLMHAAERLQSALVNTYTSGSHMVKTSVSMGISFYPRHGTTFTELYDKADIAMYHCKRNGKNGWTVYQDTIENAENILADISLKRLVQLHVADIVGIRLFHDLLTALHRILINRPSVLSTARHHLYRAL